MRRGGPPSGVAEPPRFRGMVSVTFPALHTVPALADGADVGRPHGHDFRVEFLFESTALAYPGVVVDDVLRARIVDHVEKRLAYRDLDRVLDRPATCEAIAENLGVWFSRSVSPPEHARLVSVTVTTASGGFGQINLPPPQAWSPVVR